MFYFTQLNNKLNDFIKVIRYDFGNLTLTAGQEHLGEQPLRAVSGYTPIGIVGHYSGQAYVQMPLLRILNSTTIQYRFVNLASVSVTTDGASAYILYIKD